MLLQLPTMVNAKQLLHSIPDFQTRTIVEFERAETSTVQETMVISARKDIIYKNDSWRECGSNDSANFNKQGLFSMHIVKMQVTKVPPVYGEEKNGA